MALSFYDNGGKRWDLNSATLFLQRLSRLWDERKVAMTYIMRS
jgi:hypothetical protein